MKTTVNPIGDKEYDVDDGVYIQGYSDKDISEWPSTTTVHTWVKDVVQGYTSTNPIDKNTCVRVVFAENYNEILSGIFGNRFPKVEKDKEEQENYIKTTSPAIIKNDGHSA